MIKFENDGEVFFEGDSSFAVFSCKCGVCINFPNKSDYRYFCKCGIIWKLGENIGCVLVAEEKDV